jgi:hypothetical protein
MKFIFRHMSSGLGMFMLMIHTADAQTKYPVVLKVQLHFSAVSHTSTISARVALYNANGGNSNYAVPFLVCDPVVTLYNPYPVPITVNRLRVRISDPPVGFRFKKNSTYLRQDFTNGTYLGLSRFQTQNESSTFARKHLFPGPSTTGTTPRTSPISMAEPAISSARSVFPGRISERAINGTIWRLRAGWWALTIRLRRRPASCMAGLPPN